MRILISICDNYESNCYDHYRFCPDQNWDR